MGARQRKPSDQFVAFFFCRIGEGTMNLRLFAILLLGFCLLAADVSARKEKEAKEEDADDVKDDKEETKADDEDADEKKEEDAEAKSETEDKDDAADEDKEDAAEDKKDDDDDDKAPFTCNLKFKKVGCYADKAKKERPLRSFIMSDSDLGSTTKKGKLPAGDKFNSELPKFACKCANEAINSGNAIFGLQNLAECWTGPDDSKYDKDGASEDCVTFDYAQCEANSELCSGKKHANFVYYVDTPEHTKSKEEIKKEYAEYQKKVAAWKKKQAAKKAAKKLKKKKGKKSKN